MTLTEDTKLKLRAFLHSAHGVELMSYLAQTAPVAPVEVGGKMEPHHVQINYGFDLGLKARLKQLEDVVETEELPDIDASPRLHDTRTL